jgi:hypothetical protein
MARIKGVSPAQAGLYVKIAYHFTRRSIATLTGRQAERMIEPLEMYAHVPVLFKGYAKLEQATAKLHRLDKRLHALAELKAATLPPGVPAPPDTQRAGQPRADLLIVIVGEQCHRHREIDHDMRRELPVRALRLPSRRRHRVIDNIARHNRQHRAAQRTPAPPARSGPSNARQQPLQHSESQIVIITTGRPAWGNDTPRSKINLR